MKIKAPLFLIFALICSNTLFGQKIFFEDYFPLHKGNMKIYYVSHIKAKDTLQDKNDSSICNSKFVKGKEIFYFVDNLNSNEHSLIGYKSFCNGVFYIEKGRFMFSPIDWEKDIEDANLDYFEMLFPKRIALNKVYKVQNGEEKRKYIFIGFENVSIKNNVFKGCLKLKIISDWITEQYIDTVWFQKEVGVIKWLRSTGRLEEMKLE